MAFIRRMKSFTLFKYLVLPALLLCAVIKKPAMQWIALLAVLLWIGLIAFEGVFRINQQRKRKSMSRRKPVPPQAPVSDGQSTPRVDQDIQTAHNELFLIRQVNYRITEQLKTSYPLVACEAGCQSVMSRRQVSDPHLQHGSIQLRRGRVE